jgi:transcriptional regulator with XRE-family HTH domain
MSHDIANVDLRVGSRLTALRQRLGLGMVEVAENAGVAVELLASFETGRRRPSPDELVTLAKILDVSVSDFFNPKPIEQTTNVVYLRNQLRKSN